MNTKFYTLLDYKLSEGAHLHAHLFSYGELTEIVFFFFNWTSSVKMKNTYTMTVANNMMFSARKGQVKKKKIPTGEMKCNH